MPAPPPPPPCPCHGTIQRQYRETHSLLRHVIASADTTLKAVVSAKGWKSETKQPLHDAVALAQGASLAGRRLQSDLRHLMSKCRAGDTQAKLDFEAVGEAIRVAMSLVTADGTREDTRTCVRVSFRFPQPNVQVRGFACTCPLYITTTCIMLLYPHELMSRMHTLSPPPSPPQRAVSTFLSRVAGVVTSPEVVVVSGRLCVVVCCCAQVRGCTGGGG
jgi:hypothetical protein